MALFVEEDILRYVALLPETRSPSGAFKVMDQNEEYEESRKVQILIFGFHLGQLPWEIQKVVR